MKKTT